MELAVHEFPLTFFTTLAPLGAGAFFMLALSFCFGDFSKDQLKKIDRLTIIPLLVALVGLIASFFHLANPGHALNIASTVGSTPQGLCASGRHPWSYRGALHRTCVRDPHYSYME